MTFSITAYDTAAGSCGIAISTCMPAVGSLCVFVRAGHGAIATQAWINPLLGVDGRQLLATRSATETLRELLRRDPRPDLRQVALVDGNGDAAAHTGDRTYPTSGHRTGPGYVAAGNTLVDEDTITAMAHTYETAADLALPERLLRALEAGQGAGGDRRGRQSAALHVVAQQPYPYLDLRVDDHPDPVAELRRLHSLAQHELLPFAAAMPTRENPAGTFTEDFAEAFGPSPPTAGSPAEEM